MPDISANGKLFTQFFSSVSHIFIQNRAQDQSGLTELQDFTLRTVNDKPGITMTQLSTKIGITNSQLTRIITTLEKAGLVKREHNTENRRIVNVQSTSAGLDLIQQNINAVAKRYDEQLQQLSEAEQKALISSLQTSLELLNKAGILKNSSKDN